MGRVADVVVEIAAVTTGLRHRLDRLGADALGSSDCEQLGGGWLAQPVNAVTSSAFVVVGAVVVAAMMLRPVDRVRTVVYAACVAGIGIGSVLYHGPQPPGAQFAHDVPILLTVWFIVVQDLRLLRDRPSGDLRWFAAGAVVAGGMGVAAIGTIPALTAVGVVAIAVLEIGIARRRLRPQGGHRGSVVALLVVGTAAVAMATWVLGRTDSPLCDPDTSFQLHGVWHLLSALLLGLWWWLAFWLPAGGGTGRRRRRPAADQRLRARNARSRSMRRYSQMSVTIRP